MTNVGPEAVAARLRRRTAAAQDGDRGPDAVASLRSSLCLEPGNGRTACDLAVAFATSARPRDALTWLSRALRLAPDLPAALYNRSSLLLRHGDPVGALRHARALSLLDPSSWPGMVGLVKASRHAPVSRDYRKALAWADRLRPGKEDQRPFLAELECRDMHASLDRTWGSRPRRRGTVAMPPDVAAPAESDAAGSVVRAILSGVPCHDPFSHALVRGFLPEPLYRAARDLVPDDRRFESLPRERNPHRRSVGTEAPHASAPWRTLVTTLTSEPVLAAILTLFDAWDIRTAIDEAGLVLRGSARMTIDQRRYALGPHRDHPSRICTGLIYVATDDTPGCLGTTVYRPKRPIEFYDWGYHHPFDRFEPVEHMPFEANACLLFMNFGAPYHGVAPVTAATRRPVIQFTFQAERPSGPTGTPIR